MNTLTFILVLYVFIGIGTGIFGALSSDDGKKARVIGWPLIWPLVWFMMVSVYLSGRGPAKCVWCGQVVGSMHKDDIEMWRAHYVNNCDKHPLAVKARRLENYMDELDAKNTYHRVKLETSTATLFLMRSAIKGILANPQGCPMCDAGVLRNPEKKHWPDCPYEIARARLALLEE